jgi:hemolysin activation/secretion protein
VRGYLESEVVGDDGIFGSLELRTPPLMFEGKSADWRFYLFGDAGELKVLNPLPEQVARFNLSSFGMGSRLSLVDHLSGGVDIAYPMVSQTYTQAHEIQMRFRVRLDY